YGGETAAHAAWLIGKRLVGEQRVGKRRVGWSARGHGRRALVLALSARTLFSGRVPHGLLNAAGCIFRAPWTRSVAPPFPGAPSFRRSWPLGCSRFPACVEART